MERLIIAMGLWVLAMAYTADQNPPHYEYADRHQTLSLPDYYRD